MTTNHAQCLLFHNRPVMATREMKTNWSQAIPVCDQCYELFYGKGIPFEIVRYSEEELEIVDREGRRVPHEKLWFYQKSTILPVKEARNRMARHIRESNRNLWELAKYVLETRANEAWSVLGYDSLYAFTKTLGLDTARTKRLCRVAKCLQEWATSDEIPPVLHKISPDTADQYRNMTLEQIKQELTEIDISLDT